MVGARSAHLLRGHVGDGADQIRQLRLRSLAIGSSGVGQRRTGRPGDSEIEDLQPALARDEEVLGLDVAVDEAFLVGGGQAPGKLRSVLERLAHRQRPAPHPQPQRLAFEQLGDDVRADLVVADVVDGEDVGVLERAGGPRFLFQAPLVLGIVPAGRQHLDRHRAVELLVVRREHAPHAAAPQLLADAVAAREHPLPGRGHDRRRSGPGRQWRDRRSRRGLRGARQTLPRALHALPALS